jgi:hypothetical protein
MWIILQKFKSLRYVSKVLGTYVVLDEAVFKANLKSMR